MFSLPRVGVSFDACIEECIAPGVGERGERYRLFNEAAAMAAPGAGGLYIDPLALPSPGGLAERARADVARAIMEGAAFAMRRRIAELEELAIPARRIVMVGGPAESPVWPRIVSDVTGLRLELLNGQTAGALGGAILAGVAAGVFADERAGFAALGGESQRISPHPGRCRLYEDLYRNYRDAVG